MDKKAVIYGIITVTVAVIIYLIIIQVTSPGAPDEQEPVSCGTKTVFRYKYPSKAFPLVTVDYNAEVKFTSDVLKKISDSAGSIDMGVNVKNHAKELQEKLNQDNITFSTGLRNYFFSVNSDPCNDTLRNRYATFTEEMSRRMLELRNITSQVTTITEKGTSSHPANVEVDTSKILKLPKYTLVRDTSNLKKSILKLDVAIKKNQTISSSITPHLLSK
jgi:hypothetical protein